MKKRKCNLRRKFRQLYQRLYYWLEWRFSDERHNPWRCAACGALSVERKISIDVNSNDFDFGGIYEEFVCIHCEHKSIIRQSELIRNIDDWFENHLQPDDPEVISGLDYGDFASEEEYDAACKKLWDARSVEEKIEVWRTLTNRSEV